MSDGRAMYRFDLMEGVRQLPASGVYSLAVSGLLLVVELYQSATCTLSHAQFDFEALGRAISTIPLFLLAFSFGIASAFSCRSAGWIAWLPLPMPFLALLLPSVSGLLALVHRLAH